MAPVDPLKRNTLSNAPASEGFVLRDNPRDSALSLASIVEPKDLSVVFQPIVDLGAGGRVFAHEVLTRCSKPEFKNPTALFERVVQGRCCGRLGRMIREIAVPLCSGVPLFVNVHPIELVDGWVVRADDPVLSHDHDIYLEITESVSFSHFQLCMDVLRELRSRGGVHLVVDDLGAGHSNLKRIADLQPAVVKIDIQLVKDIHLHPRQQRLVRGIVRLCVDLGAKVVAEGIETTDELAAVVDTGVHYGQGYLFARPAFPIPTVYWPG
ncbi:MAG: EAL domain-containing protein [Polyangiaceae bacterium]|nr:EAL domain-containing protein [Polyangiaceae bacterium]